MKLILLDAHRLGLYDGSPLEGVKPPQYNPAKAVIPSVAQLAQIRVAGDDTFRLIADLMSGCGLRNGEAAAVNLRGMVAHDVYRISEQVNQTSGQYAPQAPQRRRVPGRAAAGPNPGDRRVVRRNTARTAVPAAVGPPGLTAVATRSATVSSVPSTV
ncbi:hypothetical protein ACIP79_13010 [Streptomyces sp. NPDC088747]|uniref:hypothetical protein n=1 Tax=Streptomyces sp. NPDC088747 TaxID=3365886 RepID=UPI003816C37A